MYGRKSRGGATSHWPNISLWLGSTYREGAGGGGDIRMRVGARLSRYVNTSGLESIPILPLVEGTDVPVR